MNRRDLLKGGAAAAVAGLTLKGDLTPEAAKEVTLSQEPTRMTVPNVHFSAMPYDGEVLLSAAGYWTNSTGPK